VLVEKFGIAPVSPNANDDITACMNRVA
jgi:hypothetical protein